MKKLKNKEKLPIIKVSKVTEHKDGSATYYFDYEDDFRDIVSKDLGVKKATKKEVGEFIYKCLLEGLKREEENGRN